MAIYKPSNLSPSLEEIDVTQDQIFSGQVNTSGETVVGYKNQILFENSNKIQYYGRYTDTIYSDGTSKKINARNKEMLKMPIDAHSLTASGIINGKNYQWSTRFYTKDYNTLVCSGFITGSTKNVIWSKIADQKGVNKDIIDQIIYDRYIEFTNIRPEKIILSAKDDPKQIRLPTENYTERQQIDWVEYELGNNKNFLKIETKEPFKYNYADGVQYNIYKCSDKHTVNSIFIDPNSNVNIADWIVIYSNAADAESARASFLNDPDSGNVLFPKRKISGYSSDTGEIRVHDSFSSAPKNGMAYRIFSQDVETKKFTEVFSSNIRFTVPANKQLYNYYATNQAYYSDTQLTTQVGTLGQDTKVTSVLVNDRYSIINLNNTTYYVSSVKSTTTEKELVPTSIGSSCATVMINDILYNVLFTDIQINGQSVSSHSPYVEQIIGGQPISNSLYTVLSNKWETDGTDNRIFIQPNINIKTDNNFQNYYNPAQDEENKNDIIVFSSSNSDFKIRLVMQREKIYPSTEIDPLNPNTFNDITINRLDNTQWILENNSLEQYSEQGTSFPKDPNNNIQPQTNYKVYTKFVDSSPNCIFYGRSSPVIDIQYYNSRTNTYESFNEDFDEDEDWSLYYQATNLDYRDIKLQTSFTVPDNQEVKYYKYRLYSAPKSFDIDDKLSRKINITWNLVKESEDVYNFPITWEYFGLLTGKTIETPGFYKIEVEIADEYGKVFRKVNYFSVYYITNSGTDMTVTYDCDRKANRLTPIAPYFGYPQDYIGNDRITVDDLHPTHGVGGLYYDDFIEIPGAPLNSNKYLLYNKYNSETGVFPICLPNEFGLLVQFQITQDFIDTIPFDINSTRAPIFTIQYGMPEDEDEQEFFEYKTLTLYLNNFLSYKILEDGTYLINKKRACFEIENHNGELQNCFNFQPLHRPDESVQNNDFDSAILPISYTGEPFYYPSDYIFGIRDNINQYIILDAEPQTLIPGKKYIFTKNIENKYLKDAVYIVQDNKLSIENIEYVYPNNVSDLDGLVYPANYSIEDKYQLLMVPDFCKDNTLENPGGIKWPIDFSGSAIQYNQLWVDNALYSSNEFYKQMAVHHKKDQNHLYEGNWFSLYLSVIDHTHFVREYDRKYEIKCEIKATQRERWGGINDR